MEWHLTSLAAALAVFLLTRRPIYKLTMTWYSRRALTPLELSMEQLLYSYEEITYYVNIPTSNPDVLNARKEDLYVKIEYGSFFNPSVKGVQVFQRTGPHEKMLIAYLPVERYCIPLLRIFLLRKQMTNETYNRIVACKLLQKQTVQEIHEEVYQQLRRANRFL